MRIEPLEDGALPALAAFFREVGASVAPENLEQFSMPRVTDSGIRVGTLVMKDGDRIVGSIGYVDTVLRVSGGTKGYENATRQEIARWPINQFLLAEFRGRGLGKQLMDVAWDGATCLLVIGGTSASIPSRKKSGWSLIGNLDCWRFRAPARWLLSPRKLRDRYHQADRIVPPDEVPLRVGGREVVAQRCHGISGWLPWITPDPARRQIELGVPHDADYLRFAFFGALARYHVLYTVSVGGALAGFFVLAARLERPPFLSVEIVDLDAAPGHEADVIEAARVTGFTRGDIVRLRVCGERFTQTLRSLAGNLRQGPDHGFRIYYRPESVVSAASAASLTNWRLTYGDHDQYRVRATSRAWIER